MSELNKDKTRLIIQEENESLQITLNRVVEMIQRALVDSGLDVALLLSQVIELVPGMVYLRRNDGTFLLANHQVAYFYGQTVEGLLQIAGADTLALNERAAQLWSADEEVIRTGTPRRLDEYTQSFTGKEIFYKTIKVPLAIRPCQGGHPTIESDLLLGETTNAVLSVSVDVTALTDSEKDRYSLNYDPLTGLANRSLLRCYMKQAITRATQYHRMGALLLLDLDNFRGINEIYGHYVADDLLKKVVNALVHHVDSKQVLARFSGDEFALLISDANTKAEVLAVAQSILDEFKEAFLVGEHRILLNISVGVCFFPEEALSFESVLRNADVALSMAKREGGRCCQVYAPTLNASLQRRHLITNQLLQAIADDEFTLFYQPIISVETGSIVGMEALMRWNQRHSILTNQSEFIAIAEQTGLINPMGEWVIKKAIQEQQQWLEKNPDVFLAVNLSAVQFQQAEFGQQITCIVTESGLDPRRLELEITESAIMQDVEETTRTMDLFHAMGLSLSIDDFGTGYSSLSYLKRFPVQKIKIDQSFVKDIGHDPDTETITTAIINLGHNLGLKVVAEGVGNETQLSFLKGAKVDYLQGFYFSNPLPVSAFHRWAKQYQKRQLPCRRK